MGYIGNQTSNSYTSITKQDITGDGGTGYTLDHAVANANEIEVFVNNVRQEPSVAYTVSGTALTMTGNVAASDSFYVVFQGKALQSVVPPDDSVTTARINDGAVTTAKIAANAVTEAKMFSGFNNGTTELDVWNMTSNVSITASGTADITANLSRWTSDWEKIGTGMTESSGIFTFPSTGKWIVSGAWYYNSNGNRAYMGGHILVSKDSGSTYAERAQQFNDANQSGAHAGVSANAYVDVTDASTFRVKFRRQTEGTGTLYGNATILRTYFTFQKIADT